MQLIQIGETQQIKQKTVLELVQEMAARQLAEVEQLKMAALTRAKGRRRLRTWARCSSKAAVSKAAASKAAA